ncbi:hypothetical protein F5Y10DRAFT_102593 [Nemania abortiva]|nr:hypothetical protein F5Y10DRAFT_102593 [Nemania abortiva]
MFPANAKVSVWKPPGPEIPASEIETLHITIALHGGELSQSLVLRNPDKFTRFPSCKDRGSVRVVQCANNEPMILHYLTSGTPTIILCVKCCVARNQLVSHTGYTVC